MSNSLTTRVFIVEDHEMFRAGLRHILETTPGFECVGETNQLHGAIQKIHQTQPDIVLMDMNLKGENSLKVIKALRVRRELPLIAVLTNYGDMDLVNQVRQAGANAYIMKDESRARLIQILDQLRPGHFLASTEISLERLRDDGFLEFASLSPRELECLKVLAQGHSGVEAAEIMNISINTLKNHRKNIYRKLNISSKYEMITFCRENKIFG
jgi:DNA-binding NarL/FixJ family response regulator